MTQRSQRSHLTRREVLAATAAATVAAAAAPVAEGVAAAAAPDPAPAPAPSELDRVLIEQGCRHAAQGWRPSGGWSGGDGLDG